MRKAAVTLALLCVFASLAKAQIVPPAPGVDIPDQVLQSVNEKGAGAFQFKRAWIEKARTTRAARERFIEERGFYQRDLIPAAERPSVAITGNFAVPVFAVKYSDTGADPYPVSTLQARLYSGPHAPRTLTEYYDEISYGDLNLTGTVYGWTLLSGTNAFYAGAGTCNGLCGSANIDNLIIETMNANDGAIDFSQYDNDGPDGLPDSGDDDGYVDFVAFVHPEAGAECGVSGNIWSHRYALSGWTGSPYITNDARTGGGFIRVDDYVIQPAFNCGGATVIDIGVYCHEYGHAFGLPDLYDTNGGSQGVGHWCLMGSGNWNTPTDPGHMSAWSKNELGWVDVTVVDNPPANYNIPNVENNRDVFRLDVMQERWRRSSECPLAGTYSMKCGLTAAEAAARNWASGAGYGNGWSETVSHDFNYNGVGPVALTYQYSYNLEATYDFVYGEVTVGPTTSAFAVYDGTSAGLANIDLTPYLGGGPTPYRVSFRMTSDTAFSDEDGSFTTPCAAFLLDNVAVTGGGEAHSANFETRENGWACDMTVPNEHFLVENRKPLGSDVNVWGGGGLAIWHIDDSVAHGSGNTGGPANNRPRGVVLEQADGLLNLENNINRGDAGDPFPGSTNKLAFNGGTTPNSNGYTAASTVTVQLLTGNADPMVATMTGGWPAPAVATALPGTGTSGTTVQVVIGGGGFASGATAELVGASTIPATTVEWVGKDLIAAEFDLTGAANGLYDVVVFNPYGASDALVDG
ncbi:MAG TPA: M6 family metalloprotease domain-containing protein, partial [Candidatus Krumholzibacteria bacterium]|nr:M6 family metalloprotease domain-containing protein [Candidatus Krumholzibacteria bacterium]